MSKHITEWLNAYLDGELHGSRLHHVEIHLAECEACQAELESLERVSSVLNQIPMPKFTSSERFAMQVNLRLPHQKATPVRKKILEVGWWMIPVGLLVAWIFISTSVIVNDLFSAASNLGVLSNASSWMSFNTSSVTDWSAALGQIGALRGTSLSWAKSTEAFARTSLPLISLQVSIALLYLSWIVIWWARHTRREHGQLLEG